MKIYGPAEIAALKELLGMGVVPEGIDMQPAQETPFGLAGRPGFRFNYGVGNTGVWADDISQLAALQKHMGQRDLPQ